MNGILLVDKPSGWTSNDVVCKLKGIFHERRIGHSGTLDPMATGLLPVFIGKATKAVEFAENHSKKYIAGIRFGIVTDTQDISGKVLSECECNVSEQDFLNAAEAFKGNILQIPPMYSALKRNGRRLYDLARQGIELERQPRPVTVYDISLISETEQGICFSVTCSSGTYIRTLCHDIGQALGCGACMSSLRRIGCGAVRIENAFDLDCIIRCAGEERLEDLLLSTDSMFADLPEYVCSLEEERYIKNGRQIGAQIPDGTYRVYSPSGEFLMLASAESGILKSLKNFFEV